MAVRTKSISTLTLFLGVATACLPALAAEAKTYSGEWVSSSSSGALKLTVETGLTCAFGFNLPDNGSIKIESSTCKLSGEAVESVFKVDMQGQKLLAILKGNPAAGGYAGSFDLTTVDGQKLDGGTWKTAATQTAVTQTTAVTGDTYAGEWASSANAASGKMTVVLKSASQCEFSFTLPENEPVKAEPAGCKLESGSIEAEYKFEAQGYKLRTKLKGKLGDKKFEGSYQTFTPDDQQLDAGTWKAEQKKS